MVYTNQKMKMDKFVLEVKKDDTSWSDWVYGRQFFSWSLLVKAGYLSER